MVQHTAKRTARLLDLNKIGFTSDWKRGQYFAIIDKVGTFVPHSSRVIREQEGFPKNLLELDEIFGFPILRAPQFGTIVRCNHLRNSCRHSAVECGLDADCFPAKRHDR
ncbi:hypothetical protein AC630_41150 [Bradyrhizobium sp. AS23.2]|nr:hypothetical protein AC630_41150 [Bradyrhizobium sp. AS23.2]